MNSENTELASAETSNEIELLFKRFKNASDSDSRYLLDFSKIFIYNLLMNSSALTAFENSITELKKTQPVIDYCDSYHGKREYTDWYPISTLDLYYESMKLLLKMKNAGSVNAEIWLLEGASLRPVIDNAKQNIVLKGMDFSEEALKKVSNLWGQRMIGEYHFFCCVSVINDSINPTFLFMFLDSVFSNEKLMQDVANDNRFLMSPSQCSIVFQKMIMENYKSKFLTYLELNNPYVDLRLLRLFYAGEIFLADDDIKEKLIKNIISENQNHNSVILANEIIVFDRKNRNKTKFKIEDLRKLDSIYFALSLTMELRAIVSNSQLDNEFKITCSKDRISTNSDYAFFTAWSESKHVGVCHWIKELAFNHRGSNHDKLYAVLYDASKPECTAYECPLELAVDQIQSNANRNFSNVVLIGDTIFMLIRHGRYDRSGCICFDILAFDLINLTWFIAKKSPGSLVLKMEEFDQNNPEYLSFSIFQNENSTSTYDIQFKIEMNEVIHECRFNSFLEEVDGDKKNMKSSVVNIEKYKS